MSYLSSLLADDERVLMVARRHAVFLIGRIVIYLFAAVVLAVTGVWLASAFTLYLGIPCWLAALVALTVAAIRVQSWRHEQYIVTNHRIIQIEGFFNRRVFDSSLEKVNDILLTQSLVGRLFDYGTIQIITGSDIGLNRLDALVKPFAFKRVIVEARNDLDDLDRIQPEPSQQAQLLAALNDLRASGLLTDAEYEIKRTRLIGTS